MLALSAPRKPAPMLARGALGLRLHVRPKAFGNALGESIAESMQSGPDESAAETARLRRQATGGGGNSGGASGSWDAPAVDYSLTAGGRVRLGTGSVEPSAEDLQAAFRTSERDYRQATDTGAVIRAGDTLERLAGGDKEMMGRYAAGMGLRSMNELRVGQSMVADWGMNAGDAVASSNRFYVADASSKASRAAERLGEEIAPLAGLRETVRGISGSAEANGIAEDFQRRAAVLMQSADQAQAGGNSAMAQAYRRAAGNYVVAGGEAGQAGTSFIDGAAIPRTFVNPPEFQVPAGWSYMGQNSVGFVQGRGIFPDYQSINLGVNTLTGTVTTNLHDGTVAYGGGVAATNVDPGVRPTPSYSIGWIFGVDDAKGVTDFITGSGTQFGVAIPTTWKLSPSININHSYGGGWALELGVGPRTSGTVFTYQPYGYSKEVGK